MDVHRNTRHACPATRRKHGTQDGITPTERCHPARDAKPTSKKCFERAFFSRGKHKSTRNTLIRFSLGHLLFAVDIAACVAWSISLGISRTSHNIEANRSTYAARLVAHMCVAHMKANSHTWPRDWGDLRDDFSPCLAQSGQSWTSQVQYSRNTNQ